MAIIRKNELALLKEPEINQKLTELEQELMRLNAQRATKTTPTNPGRIKLIKRTRAKLFTMLNKNKIQEVR
jgi:ribosomal protein L29